MQKRSVGKTGSTTTLTSAEVKTRLEEGTAGLGAEEEKALRMLHGVGASRSLVLERVGQNHPETAARLLDIELELLRQLKARQAAARPVAEVRPAASPRRDALVNALKSKTPR